jgi:PAS domain S-box-containing protein
MGRRDISRLQLPGGPFQNGPVSPDPRPPAGSAWLVRKGELGNAIAARAWEQTAFGRLELWPPHLRVAVNLILEADAPMAVIWGPQFHFLYNDRYAQMIADKHPAALGAPGEEIFPELWPAVAPLFARTLAGEAVVIEDFELPLTRGGVTAPGYFSFSYSPLRNDAGSVDGFLAVVIETTARVAREQERAQTFDTVLSAIVDFAYTFDRDGRFLYVNKALLDLWGLPLEQAVGKNFFDLKYPDDLAGRLQSQIQQVIADRAAVRDETRYVSPTGVEGYYEYIFSPVFAPDGSVRVVAGSTRDITCRKQLELAALASAKAKDDFLASLSHELRTPLNPVLLLATDAAADPNLPAEIRADFQTIADQVSLEARLIDDLLDISRITHNKLPLRLAPQDVHRLLGRTLASAETELKANGLSVMARLEARPSVVIGDELRLQQIFGNLIRNAAKFSPRGGPIGVRTHVDPQRPDLLVIEVTDTGLGLTAAELEKIFNPFAQGEHATDGPGRFGGLGLGLAISRKIAELHGGSIAARSAGRDRGATFTVELPLAPAETAAPPIEQADSGASFPPPATIPARVLLVEDHETSRLALARLLANRRFDVISASSVREALSKAREHPIELVISDLGLPDGDGCDLMKQLKADYGCYGIALSGYGSRQDIARSKAAGFTTHLTKPVQSRALDEALEQFARRSPAPS